MDFITIPRIIKHLSNRVLLHETVFGNRTKTTCECVGVTADGRLWRYFRSEERNDEGVLCIAISYGFTELPPGTQVA